jgi:hypothetical protein
VKVYTLDPKYRPPSQYSDFVDYETVAEYRKHFVDAYCGAPLYTFDSIPVTFQRGQFDHAFFPEGSFSLARAKRINWICKALQDPSAWLCPGWDWALLNYNRSRRVCFVNGAYVVVIEFVASDEAFFKTAYPANGRTPRKIMESPRW